ncbi:MAG: DUF1697 domain-containing protein [Magnetospirillum sp.]|nr:DUF1697 domain-containing protein [Magnetospirillum sp.]
MAVRVALLRAVNVGGTGVLAMDDLSRLCVEIGLRSPRTYLASGNVVFDSDDGEAAIKTALEQGLARHMGTPVDVLIRNAAEMAAVLDGNPFPGADPRRTVAIFLDAPPPPDLLDGVTGRQGEEIRPGRREIYVHYGDGMARSRLRIAAAAKGTARNMNTVARLSAMATSRP